MFDSVAEGYDRARPGYPPAMFDDLRSHGVGPATSVLEIGCGTGQATRHLAEIAGSVTCVELGGELARVAERNLAGSEHVRVLVGAFEDVELPFSSFDVVFSATAFHWIDPSVAYPRAASLLRTGGALALATNMHVAGGTQAEILDGVSALHLELCPELGPFTFLSAADLTARAHAGGDIAHLWHRIERRFEDAPDVSGLFAPPVVHAYEWTVTYDRDRYLEMLSTQSPYLGIDPDRRARLFERIGALIDARLGGSAVKPYLTVLAVSASLES
jgi:SAM-dependent methyltransferase